MKKISKTQVIENELDRMISEKQFGEGDRTSAKAILNWIIKGPKAAEKISPEACKNLRKMGFVTEDGKLRFNPDSKESGIEFIMLVCGAKGWIRMTTGGKKNDAPSRPRSR